MPAQPGAGRIVLLVTTHRVPPGLLAWPAWEALRTAAQVLTRQADHPQRPYVEAAGTAVDVLDDMPVRRLADLLVAAARGGTVVLLSGADGDPGLGAALAATLARRGEVEPVPEVEVLPGSWDLPGARLLDLVAVMDRLRSPGGCPWDAEQTHASLVPYLVEEAYETLEAIESDDLAHLQEELGDLLLQVVFHARIGEEHPRTPWSLDDVAAGIVEKLVRRHPHVFDATAAGDRPTASGVEANWEVLKAAEKQRTSAVEGVPLALPALTLAAKLMSRAARAGVPVDVAAPPASVPVADPVQLGDLLLGIVAAAAARGIDAEAALRAANRRYAERVRAAEQTASTS